MSQDLTTFWDNCDPKMSHIYHKFDDLFKDWSKYIFNEFVDFKDKTILDYGIGSGNMCIAAHEMKAKKYYGVDISTRSLTTSEKRFNDYKISQDFYNLDLTDKFYNTPDFYSKCDMFISVAVIQHFPNKSQLNNFLTCLNKTRIPMIFLQIRHSEPEQFGNKDGILKNHNHSILQACMTNARELVKYLVDYKLVYESETRPVCNYRYLIFELLE